MNTVRHYILSFVLLMPALLLASATQKSDTASKSNDDALAVFYTIEGNIQEKHNEIIRQK